MKRFFGFLAAILCAATTGHTLPIDTFNESQSVTCTQINCNQGSAIFTSTTFTGARKIFLTLQSASSNSLSVSPAGSPNTFKYTGLASATGIGGIIWDGTINEPSKVKNGAKVYNFTGSTGIRLLFGALQTKGSVPPPITISLYDIGSIIAAGSAEPTGYFAVVNLSNDYSGRDLLIPYTQFKDSLNNPVPVSVLSNLAAIRFTVWGNGFSEFNLKCIESAGGTSGTDFCVAPPPPTPTPTNTQVQDEVPIPPFVTRTPTPTLIPSGPPGLPPGYGNTPIAPPGNPPGNPPGIPVQPTPDFQGCSATSNASRNNSLTKAARAQEKVIESVLRPAINMVKNNTDKYSKSYLQSANSTLSKAKNLANSNARIFEVAPAFDNSCASAQSCRTYSYKKDKKKYTKQAKQLSNLINNALSVKRQVRTVFPHSSLGSNSTDSRDIGKAKSALKKALKLTKKIPASTKVCN